MIFNYIYLFLFVNTNNTIVMFIIFFISARITSFLLDVFEIRGSMVLSALKGDKLDSEITFWSERKIFFIQIELGELRKNSYILSLYLVLVYK